MSTPLPADSNRTLRWGAYLIALSGIGIIGNGIAMLYRAFYSAGFEAGVDSLGGVTKAELATANHELLHYITLLARERYEFDYVPLVANLLELVPVRDEEERQIVLKAVNYYDEGRTSFDAFHAATAETRGMDVLSSEKDYEDIEVERVPLEPADE